MGSDGNVPQCAGDTALTSVYEHTLYQVLSKHWGQKTEVVPHLMPMALTAKTDIFISFYFNEIIRAHDKGSAGKEACVT